MSKTLPIVDDEVSFLTAISRLHRAYGFSRSNKPCP